MFRRIILIRKTMSAAGARGAARARGFTLPEMIVLMVVIAVIAAVALPRMGNDPILVSAQADQLASDIRYVQTLAMTEGQRYVIAFPSATSYRILDSGGNPVAHPLSGSSAALVLPAGFTLALQATNPAGNALGFDGLGVPYSVTAPATFNGPLVAQATIALTRDAATQQVRIAPQTGKTTP